MVSLTLSISGLRRLLFGIAAAAALAARGEFQLPDDAFDLEQLRMRLALRRDHRCISAAAFAALQVFLQQGFGILAQRLHIEPAR